MEKLLSRSNIAIVSLTKRALKLIQFNIQRTLRQKDLILNQIVALHWFSEAIAEEHEILWDSWTCSKLSQNDSFKWSANNFAVHCQTIMCVCVRGRELSLGWWEVEQLMSFHDFQMPHCFPIRMLREIHHLVNLQ